MESTHRKAECAENRDISVADYEGCLVAILGEMIEDALRYEICIGNLLVSDGAGSARDFSVLVDKSDKHKGGSEPCLDCKT